MASQRGFKWSFTITAFKNRISKLVFLKKIIIYLTYCTFKYTLLFIEIDLLLTFKNKKYNFVSGMRYEYKPVDGSMNVVRS